jgi:hypothetical protein
MSTRNPDLDLDLSTDIPDLPPPWPPTDVAIQWWQSFKRMMPGNLTLDDYLARTGREHYDEPFVMD